MSDSTLDKQHPDSPVPTTALLVRLSGETVAALKFAAAGNYPPAVAALHAVQRDIDAAEHVYDDHIPAPYCSDCGYVYHRDDTHHVCPDSTTRGGI